MDRTAPSGRLYGRDGRGPFRLDDPAAVIASTTALQMNAACPSTTTMPPISARPKDGPLRRPDGFANSKCAAARYGDGSNGRRGRQVRSWRAEYRYVSPVFQFDPKDGSVTRLLRAGLTNNPNLHLTAIAASRIAAADNQTKDQRMEFPIQEIARVA